MSDAIQFSETRAKAADSRRIDTWRSEGTIHERVVALDPAVRGEGARLRP